MAGRQQLCGLALGAACLGANGDSCPRSSGGDSRSQLPISSASRHRPQTQPRWAVSRGFGVPIRAGYSSLAPKVKEREERMNPTDDVLGRRNFIGQIAALSGLCAVGLQTTEVFGKEASASLAAEPPSGFLPLSIPGKVACARAKGEFASIMHKNQIWPKREVARALLTRAMTDLTGASSLTSAMKLFVHPKDRVAIKINGIAGSMMVTCYELIAEVVESCIAAGVPAGQIVVFDQHASYVLASRSGAKGFPLPDGVKVTSHGNKDCAEPGVAIYQGITAKFCRQLLQSTAVINMPLLKDHGICGFTGAMKNITHGCIDNPEAHHAHYANPQIAMLYAHPVITSRVRLHITDGFRLMYDRGPLAKDPNTIVPHGAVYASTDPVALDTVGARAVEAERKKHGLASLEKAGRAPRYIQSAGDLGLGVYSDAELQLVEAEV